MSKGLLLGGGALMLCILLIIFIAIIYFLTRPEKETEKETDESPTITDAGVDLVLNPGKETDKVEEYRIFKTEYALGEASAKNIDIKLKWTNGPTFTSVTSLIFVHELGTKKVRDNVTTTDNIESNASNELLFKGTDLTSEEVVGSNTIKIYWDEVKESNILKTISFTITQEHLDTPFNLTSVKNITIPVQLSSSQTASGDVVSTYTNYYILPYFTDTPVYNRKVQGDNNDGFNIIKNGSKQSIDGVDKFYIVQAIGKQFLSKDPDGNSLLRYDKKFKNQNEIFGNMNAVVKSAISVREAKPFKYEFIVKHLDYLATQPQHDIAAHIYNVKLYDFNYTLIKTITNNDIEFDVQPTHSLNRDDFLGAWKSNTYNVGDKLFTITSDKPVHMMKIQYVRPRYAPGWTIKENGIVRFEDTRNHGTEENPTPVDYRYTLSRFDDIGDLSYSGYYDISEMEDIGLEYGLMAPNNIHDWQYDINTYEDCRQRAGEKGYNAFGFQATGTKHCWLRQVPGTGGYTVTGLQSTGEGGKKDGHVSGCALKGRKVSNNCQQIFHYGGDSNLGRDGRNACNMTDNDKKYACDNDTELFGIGSGPSCGHKFYNTDKGKGSTISSTDEYDKFYSCETKNYV